MLTRKLANIRPTPHHFFLAAALFLVVASLLAGDSRADIHINDTFYVSSFKSLSVYTATIFALFWLLYVITKRFLFSNALALLHILITTTSLLLVPALAWYANTYYSGVSSPMHYDAASFSRFKLFETMNTVIYILFLVLISAQFLYCINLVAGLVKKTSFEKNS